MKTVLLIDDDRDLRVMLARLLTDAGWRVFEAEDGEMGLSLAQQHRPDVVLCDLLMPRCNGFQVCRSIRLQHELQHTRIFVTSGRGYATDRLNALEAGAHDYLIKPVDPKRLLELLDHSVVAREPASAVAAPAELAAPTAPSVRLKFWGVRGSIPSPGASTVFYGGNTSCVEVRAGDEIIILDAGTGIRLLGEALVEEFKDRPMRVTLLISHTHWDHIQGFPFFAPAYNPRNQIRVLGYEGAQTGLAATLASQMESPFFPIGLREMPGNIAFEELKDLEFRIGTAQVRACFLNHPGICMGFRITSNGVSVAYLPDNEPFQRLRSQPGAGAPPDTNLQFARDQDEKLVQFIHGVDALIIDAQYDAAEYERHIGWGHGCLDDVVALALRAEARRLFLFHHDPKHDDDHISRRVAHGRELVAQHGGSEMLVEAAREGLELELAK